VYKLVAVAFLLSCATGCLGVPLADRETDARAKAFSAPAETANVYVYQTSRFWPPSAAIYVVLDREWVGAIVSYARFLTATVTPGTHSIFAWTYKPGPNVFPWGVGGVRSASQSFTAAAGGNYYFKLNFVRRAVFPDTVEIEQVKDEVEAQREIRECSLVVAGERPRPNGESNSDSPAPTLRTP
jgi:hypothetical protein